MDGTLNKEGTIMEEVMLMMLHKGHKEKVVFEVCDLGKAMIIISLLWLQKHNLEINWQTGKVKMAHCPPECNVFIHAARRECKPKWIAQMWKYRATIEKVEDEDTGMHIRGGVTEEGALMKENGALPNTMEEHFIRRQRDQPHGET